MPDDEVLYRTDGPLAWITLNRPDKLNALNAGAVDRLEACLARAAEDDSVKVLLLNGAGRSFCAGYDINDELDAKTETPLEWLPVLRRDVEVTMRLWAFPKPTIAVVHGYCLGGGCELAMACDLVVAAEEAQFGEPEIQYGSGPVTLLMPFILGQKKTNELLFTGDRIDATTACELGLVNRVVTGNDLEATATTLALRIAPTPLAVLRLTKQALNRTYEAMGLRDAITANIDISALLNGASTPEQQEFDRVAAERGLKAALAWRDARYAQPR